MKVNRNYHTAISVFNIIMRSIPIIFAVFTILITGCEETIESFCDNPEITIEVGTQIVLRNSLGSDCGYSYCFQIYYSDPDGNPLKGILLTNDNRDFPERQLTKFMVGDLVLEDSY